MISIRYDECRTVEELDRVYLTNRDMLEREYQYYRYLLSVNQKEKEENEKEHEQRLLQRIGRAKDRIFGRN